MKVQLIATVVCAAALAFGQAGGDRVVIPLTDPARPAKLKAHLINGSITVRAYPGKEVVVHARGGDRHHDREERRDGMRRVPMTGSGIEATEENNVVTVGTGWPMASANLDIEVPVRTSLVLKTVQNGAIVVEGVNGEIEVEDINGPITLNDVSGTVVAHALNGEMKVRFAQVDPSKPMSFSSMNGKIDVTFPPDLKANLKLKTQNGDVFSDFDLVVKASPQPITESGRDGKGKYRVKVDRTVYASVNGGGQEIQFSNFNGSIFIRKAAK